MSPLSILIFFTWVFSAFFLIDLRVCQYFLFKKPILSFIDFFLLFFVFHFSYCCSILYYFLPSANFEQILELLRRKRHRKFLFGGDLYIHWWISGIWIICSLKGDTICQLWKPDRQFMLFPKIVLKRKTDNI